MRMSTCIMARDCWAVLTAAGSCGLIVPGAKKGGISRKGVGRGCARKPRSCRAPGSCLGEVLGPARACGRPPGPSATRAGEAAATWALHWLPVCVPPGDATQPPRVMYSLCVAVTERISVNSRSYSETGAERVCLNAGMVKAEKPPPTESHQCEADLSATD